MKRFILAAVFTINGSVAFGYQYVQSWTWVSIAQPINNYQIGDQCGLRIGGIETIYGTDPKFGTLVSYILPPGTKAEGAVCPNNSIVFIGSNSYAISADEGTAALKILTKAAE